MSPDDRGLLLRRFEADPRADLATARLRLFAALLGLCAAGVLFLGSLPLPVFLIAVLGALVGLAWLRQAGHARRRAAATAASRHFLASYERGLVLGEGTAEHFTPWTDVTHIDVDEERLDVIVERRAEPPLRIEPRYPGVEIHELMRTLRDAWSKAHQRSPGASP